MKVELKSFKFFPSMSEETNCFQATIYIDGKKVGTAENRGVGGMTDLHIQDQKIREAFSTWAKALPPHESQYGQLEMSADFYIDLLVDELIEEQEKKKEVKRLAKIKAEMAKKGFQTTVQVNYPDSYVCVGVRNFSEHTVPEIAKKYNVEQKNVVVL